MRGRHAGIRARRHDRQGYPAIPINGCAPIQVCPVATLLTVGDCGRARCAGQSQDLIKSASLHGFFLRCSSGLCIFKMRKKLPPCIEIQQVTFEFLCAKHGTLRSPYCATTYRLFLQTGRSICASREIYPYDVAHLPSREVQFAACRRWLSELVDRSSCAGQSFFLRGIGYPTHGICGRQTEQRKNKGWQDRLSPVSGTMCGTARFS